MKGRGIVVVGAQFGDEGKGRIVDELSETADIVARYQGGSNAGHTVVAEGRKHKLHLLPTGVVRRRRSLVCAGVVVDPLKLLGEIKELRENGIAIDENVLGIDVRAQMVMPWHREAEAQSGLGAAIGTTGQGIGPAYADATARTGLRFAEFLDEKALAQKISERTVAKTVLAETSGGKSVEEENHGLEKIMFNEYSRAASELEKFSCDASGEINEALGRGKRVLFEGAQGTLLDNTFGTYPFVTSSHPIAGGACIGAGVGPSAIDEVHGIAKAYTTRVGTGPFPTELQDELGEFLVEKGGEFGTTTGRRRRVGWLDVCMLRTSDELNGFTQLHLTKLDVLGGISKLKICIAYEMPDRRVLKKMPALSTELEQATPQYVEMEGFEQLSGEDWRFVATEGREKGFDALPKQAVEYVKKVESLVGVRIASVSVGPERGMKITVKE